MKIFKLVLISISIAVFLFGIFDYSHSSTIIFSDGFEDGFLNWTGNDAQWDITSGGNTDRHEGKARADVRGNTEPGDDVLLKNISTADLGEITLEFWYKVKDSFEDEDHVYIEWSGDNSNWNILQDFTKTAKFTDWQLASYVLPAAADGKENFGIRFRADLGSGGDVFYIDDIVLSANSGIESTPSPSPTPSLSPSLEPSLTPVSTPEQESTALTQTPTPPPPTPLSSPKPTPSPLQSSSVPVVSQTPIPTPSPTFLLSPPVSPKVAGGTTVLPTAKSSLENNLIQESTEISELSGENPIEPKEAEFQPENLTASISSFFRRTKFFWLIGLLVIGVAFSIPRSNPD